MWATWEARPKRAADGGLVYHVLNRANARMPIFEKDRDYEAFEEILGEAVERTSTRLLAYCILRNHWHIVVWPSEDGELSRFAGWLTLTHTQRSPRQFGGACGGLALGQLGSLEARYGRGSGVAVALAATASPGVGRVRQHTTKRSGVESVASQREARMSLRR